MGDVGFEQYGGDFDINAYLPSFSDILLRVAIEGERKTGAPARDLVERIGPKPENCNEIPDRLA
jgi:hypothetical protein